MIFGWRWRGEWFRFHQRERRIRISAASLGLALRRPRVESNTLRIGTVTRSAVEVRFREPENILTFADTTFLQYSEPGAELPIYVYIDVLRDSVTGIVWRYPVDWAQEALCDYRQIDRAEH